MAWNSKVSGVVMPPNPTFDKCVGMFFLLGILNKDIGEVPIEFIGSSNPFDKNVFRLERQGYYLLDVGRNKYHTRHLSSGFEGVCVDFGMETSHDSAMRELLQVVGKNNQTGHLKAHKFSLVWALREAYKIERDQKLVIRKVMALVEAYLRSSGEKERSWSDIDEFKTLSGVMNSISHGKSGFHLFTLPWLVRTRFLLGDTVGEIRDEANWWLRVFNATEKAESESELKLEALMEWVSEEFKVCGQKACCLETDDKRAGRLLLKKGFSVVIVKRPAGNVAIMSNKKFQFDMGEVAAELDGREPERWHYDPRIQACLNGTPNWEREPTEILLEDICRIVRTKARRSRRRSPQPEKKGRW